MEEKKPLLSSAQMLDPIDSPFIVTVDSREQAPFAFAAGTIKADARQGYRPVNVRTQVGTLTSGDYSIDGHQWQIAVERKSLEDLVSTLAHGRRRFQAELSRLATYKVVAIVVEADWPMILMDPPPFSRLLPKTIYRSVIAWQQRFPTVHWWLCPSRAFAEVTTYRILERYWLDRKPKIGKGIEIC